MQEEFIDLMRGVGVSGQRKGLLWPLRHPEVLCSPKALGHISVPAPPGPRPWGSPPLLAHPLLSLFLTPAELSFFPSRTVGRFKG